MTSSVSQAAFLLPEPNTMSAFFCNPMTQLIHVQHVIYYNPRVFSKENCQLNNCSLSQIGLVALFLLGCSILHLHH